MVRAEDGDRLRDRVEALTADLDRASERLRELTDEMARARSAGAGVDEIAERAGVPRDIVVGILEGRVYVTLQDEAREYEARQDDGPQSTWIMTWADPPET
ncbi:hypothetical protein [Auraticoccus monumenti]|uniref:Sigma-70, region 4 n=1 Tax=Auraticoccus monumenti TaxID=675864 RepID=A0A1G6VB32_9ACTN|nr:hypothetical protein [Auraticoccus monumenti]SDD50910.1 hypothetical protein SAMN04489747_1106 [Auraticoccus monumenti]